MRRPRHRPRTRAYVRAILRTAAALRAGVKLLEQIVALAAAAPTSTEADRARALGEKSAAWAALKHELARVSAELAAADPAAQEAWTSGAERMPWRGLLRKLAELDQVQARLEEMEARLQAIKAGRPD